MPVGLSPAAVMAFIVIGAVFLLLRVFSQGDNEYGEEKQDMLYSHFLLYKIIMGIKETNE